MIKEAECPANRLSTLYNRWRRTKQAQSSAENLADWVGVRRIGNGGGADGLRRSRDTKGALLSGEATGSPIALLNEVLVGAVEFRLRERLLQAARSEERVNLGLQQPKILTGQPLQHALPLGFSLRHIREGLLAGEALRLNGGATCQGLVGDVGCPALKDLAGAELAEGLAVEFGDALLVEPELIGSLVKGAGTLVSREATHFVHDVALLLAFSDGTARAAEGTRASLLRTKGVALDSGAARQVFEGRLQHLLDVGIHIGLNVGRGEGLRETQGARHRLLKKFGCEAGKGASALSGLCLTGQQGFGTGDYGADAAGQRLHGADVSGDAAGTKFGSHLAVDVASLPSDAASRFEGRELVGRKAGGPLTSVGLVRLVSKLLCLRKKVGGELLGLRTKLWRSRCNRSVVAAKKAAKDAAHDMVLFKIWATGRGPACREVPVFSSRICLTRS